MIWTREDELALVACRECIEHCKARRLTPAPYFTTAVKMFEELQAADLIVRGEETTPKDLCDGCVEHVYGACRRAYQGAQLSLDGRTVVRCALQRRGDGGSMRVPGPTERGKAAEEARREEAKKWKRH